MFNTNFDPSTGGAISGNELTFPAGPRHDTLLAIQGHINALGGRMKEVDGESSPGFLDAYASRGLAAGSGDFEISPEDEGHFITYYDSADPGLSASAPYCRLFFLHSSEYGIQMRVLDTRSSSSGYGVYNGDWDTAARRYNAIYLGDAGGTNFTEAGRLYFWENDYLFVMRAVNASNEELGTIIFLSPPLPEDGHVTRIDAPMVFAMSTDTSGVGAYELLSSAGASGAWSGWGRTEWRPELGVAMRGPDATGRFFSQRMAIASGDADAPFWLGYLPSVRIVARSLVGVLSTLDIGGIEYVCVAHLRNEGAALLVQNSEPAS